jgi:hypothetical protein
LLPRASSCSPALTIEGNPSGEAVVIIRFYAGLQAPATPTDPEALRGSRRFNHPGYRRRRIHSRTRLREIATDRKDFRSFLTSFSVTNNTSREGGSATDMDARPKFAVSKLPAQ